ncbi:MAG TPA: hypothetical protein VFN53_06350 [Acidobacteriaceae bacterium]|nr:hypothetical protein [Acidobacteriaceae bacterium]
MPTPKLDMAVAQRVAERIRQGQTVAAIEAAEGVASGTVFNVRQRMKTEPALQAAKKIGVTDWREWSDWAKAGQNLKKKASNSQEQAAFSLGEGKRPVILATFSDQHIGSWGCDYDLFAQITKEIVETPNLYLAMLGDETETAIKLRSVLEVVSQVIPPEQQEQFMESWLTEIAPKVAFATWSNHGVERQEKQAGSSVVKNILSRQAVYYNGIGHADIQVGEQIYRCAASHRFTGRSMYSSTHGPRRYARHYAPDRELILQGDLHTPELMQYHEAAMHRVAITSGSLQLNSGYAKRYYTLTTIPAYPCVVLHHDKHLMVPFWAIKDAITYVNGCGK